MWLLANENFSEVFLLLMVHMSHEEHSDFEIAGRVSG